MRRLLLAFAVTMTTMVMNAQTPKNVELVFTEASDLNLIGKIHDNTPNPYHLYPKREPASKSLSWISSDVQDQFQHHFHSDRLRMGQNNQNDNVAVFAGL